MLLVKAPSSTESSVEEGFSESDQKDSSDGSLFLSFCFLFVFGWFLYCRI